MKEECEKCNSMNLAVCMTTNNELISSICLDCKHEKIYDQKMYDEGEKLYNTYRNKTKEKWGDSIEEK